MKQYLHVRPDGAGAWCVSGENLNYWAPAPDKESALYLAYCCKRDWYPRARVICQAPHDAALREERFQRLEWRDQMQSDWNE